MTKNNIIKLSRWQDFIEELPWNPRNAVMSAIKALSKSYWDGTPQEDAIDAILSLPKASHLRENRWILHAVWAAVSREMTGERMALLELEPIFDTAA